MSHLTDAVAALNALQSIRGGSDQTSDHISALRRFPGWGPLARFFDAGGDERHTRQAAELHAAADGLNLTTVTKTLDTSFYTPTPLIEHMWGLLAAAGFIGGRVLDLGCGTGRFIEHKPAGLPVAYTGVEIEPISAEIAAMLHPAAEIVVGDVATVMPGNGFDATIGNVPFASTRVYDQATAMALHTYCALKALRLTRPGGYVVLVTSRYLLDSASNPGRTLLAERANLIGAVRLPSRYFAAEGTDVVADLVVMQVRAALDTTAGPWGSGWTDGLDTVDQVHVSKYWSQHPQQVAGTMAATGFSQSPLAVHADDPHAAVAAAINGLYPRLVPMAPVSEAAHFADVALFDSDGRAEGSFHEVDDTVVCIVDGQARPVTRPSRELRALINLRNAVDDLLVADADHDRADADNAPLRTTAADRYRDYVSSFGPLNRGELVEGSVDAETGSPALRWKTPRMGGFRNDPGFWRVLAVEKYDRDTGTATAADVLTRRVNRRPAPVTRAQSPAEALAISLGEGRLDLDRVAGLLGLTSAAEAIDALGDLIFHDPTANSWVTAADYLSGQVRRKLAAAKLAVITDARYHRNVAALEAVLPEWLTPADIRVELGSPVVTARDVEQFATDVLGARSPSVDYTPIAGHWEVDLFAVTAQAKMDFGTHRCEPEKLLQAGLNSRIPTVYDEVYDPASRSSKRVRNADETEAAVAKLGEIADRFAAWVWECPTRAARIEHDYNHRFNAFVPRVPDGSRLRLPRLADNVTLWAHQKDWVDYALSLSGAMNAAEVGLGKTLSALTLAVTLRDFGLAAKPMIAVPDHLVEQISSEAARAFPSCNFLIVTRNDLTRDRRRLFAARCATGDWDAVIITHTGFSAIPMPVAYECSLLENELDTLREHLRASGIRSKRVASLIRSCENRLRALRDNTDTDMVTFDQLGIDHISVDEVDRFRRLPIQTTSEGFSLGSSIRAFDLYLKVQWLRDRSHGQPVVAGYTGTPWNNSLAESYVWQRLFAPHQLADAGVEAFDSWAAQFVRFQTLIEVSPDGSGFRSKRRPSIVQNLPELRAMLRGFMFLLRADDVGITRPTAQFHTLTADPSPVATEYMTSLVARADALRNRQVTDLSVDNMLKICGDGRAVALDTHLVGLAETPGAHTKLVCAADKVAEIYHANAHVTLPESSVPGVFQFVMCDYGTPHSDDTRTYGRLRRLLIDRGVPTHKIRFVHEANSPKARDALFASCRSGDTAVCIGSTARFGVGVNAQTRAVALHHLDMPWTAAAWEQRNGRIIRHGNVHQQVDIYSYATAGTFDAFMAGVVERKARGFARLYAINDSAREIDDIGEIALNVAEVKAAATGNPMLLRQHELRTQVRALRIAKATSMQSAVSARSLARSKRSRADQLTGTRTLLRELLNAGTFPTVNTTYAAQELAARAGRDRVQIATLACGPQHLTVDVGRRLGGHELVIKVNYQEVARRAVPADVARKGPERIAAWAKRSMNLWLRGLPEQCEELAETINDLHTAATEADTAAASVTFDKQPELDQLAAELDAVNAEVAAVAEATTRGNDTDVAA